ncbi:MAG: type II toxin-antitoxin system RelE/ParE family toxin [Candidatus Gracilibacteria bacterium]|nr:type II toxin-antitoxin system RelE/ParE family toxin [Candidatus Gracilibacteria bacterium]
MQYKVIFYSEKIIIKDFSKIPEKNKKVIFQKIKELQFHGVEKAQVKKLHNYLISDYRLRVGDYRILFNLDEKSEKIIIFRILHRSKLY